MLGVFQRQIFAHEDIKMNYKFRDTPIYYEVHGQGPILVLLHGFLESANIWKALIPKLSTSYTVVTLDLPGHGRSGVVDAVHTMELMADAVNAVLTSLHFESFTLLGHCMGGYVALAYTEKHPEQVQRLILLNSTSFEDSHERKLNRNRAIKLLGTEKSNFIGMALSNLFSEHQRHIYAHEIELLKKEAIQFSTEGIIANIKGMRDRTDRSLVLETFQNPKWLIAGTNDPIVPLEQSKKMARQTHSELKMISGSHMSWLENTDEIINFVLFID